jgi:hypothetical protein
MARRSSAPKTRDTRISLLELRVLAAERGWDFTGQPLLLLDLKYALTQAGRLGTLVFFGKRAYGGLSARAIDALASESVPQSAWSNLQLGDVGFTDIGCADNQKVELQLVNPLGQKVYIDIFTDRRSAKRWLRTEAALVKGRTAARKNSQRYGRDVIAVAKMAAAGKITSSALAGPGTTSLACPVCTYRMPLIARVALVTKASRPLWSTPSGCGRRSEAISANRD